MAKSTKKSTRKFEKNHLKDTIERRKAGAKIKQQQQMKAKRQARNTKNAELAKDTNDSQGNLTSKPNMSKDSFAEMNVDDFFQSGFEIPQKSAQKPSKSGSSEARKRKRSQLEPENDNDYSSETSPSNFPLISDNDSDSNKEDVSGMSKSAMDALAQNDPEFYKYLKENDPEVLDFSEDGDISEEEEIIKLHKKNSSSFDEEGVNSAGDTDGSDNELAAASAELTKAMVLKWKGALSEQYSLRTMRQVIVAFKAAAHVNEDNDKEYKYTITSPDVFHSLLLIALNDVPKVIAHHLPVTETPSGRVKAPTDTKRFRNLIPFLKSYISSLQHLLTSLSDSSTLNITLSAITPLLPYLLSFKKVLKGVVKTIVDIWSDPASSEATRITAFLVIRRLTVISDPGLREAVLKTVYQGMVKGCRLTTIHTIQGINLMKNSAAELWGIDQSVGYTAGFTYVRQLAIHLRNSISNNQQESYKTIYNWQYVHSLDFWSCVLSEHCSSIKVAENGKESDLQSLIYPAVQVTLGALRLIPTAAYFPLRFHLIRSLLRLSRATKTYIPLASPLLEVLDSSEMKKPPKPSTLKSLDFGTNYKAQKTFLRTRIYQDGLGEQVSDLLSEFFVLWSTSISFPELALPVIMRLRRWLKDVSNKDSGNKNSKINSGFAILIQKLEANSKWIQERRAKVDFSPNDRAGVDGFLRGFEWEKTPLGAYVVGQRKQREEMTRLVTEVREKDGVKGKESNKVSGYQEEMYIDNDSE